MKILNVIPALTALLIASACSAPSAPAQTSAVKARSDLAAQQPYMSTEVGLEVAIVAGGCFWCVESDFEKVPGVTEAVSGYTGGTLDKPSYKAVSRDNTGHFEAVKITYDPSIVSYRALIDHFWETVDPTDDGGQFCDRGSSYKTAIFATPQQLADAKGSKRALETSGRLNAEVVTPILPAVTFYDAEDYHQDYYKKSTVRYKYYRKGCGRDKRLEKLWGTSK